MATNPNPSRITAALWRLWSEFDAHAPATRLGGIYANKSGYHNTRNANASGDYSRLFAADQRGPGDKAAAIDLTFTEAQRGDYSTIIRYTKRLDTAARAKDPRLYRDGGTPVLREVIGTLDGRRPYAYDLQRRRSDYDRDDSHRWHIHLSVTRAYVEQWDALAGVLSVLTGEPLEDDMPTEREIGRAVWGYDPNAKDAGGVYNIPGRGDSGTNITVTPAWALREGWREARDGTAETRALRREQGAANAAILAAVADEDVAAAVRRELETAATRERAERAVEQQHLAGGLTAALRAALGDGLADDQLTAAVAAALRQVLGSLDE